MDAENVNDPFVLPSDQPVGEDLGAALVLELRANTINDRETFELLHKELRRRAAQKMKKERPDHTLQPTALVNEAFVKIFRNLGRGERWATEAHALNAISQAMERLLMDHASAYNASKRGGKSKERVPFDQKQAAEFGDGERHARVEAELLVLPGSSEQVVAVKESLLRLRDIAPRQARVVQLHFYCGLTHEEIAAMLDVSVETIKLDWRKARAFLKVQLEDRKS